MTKVRMRNSVCILALAGLVSACDSALPELPETTKFERLDRPELHAAENSELVRILNARRKDWGRLVYTPPSRTAAVLGFALPGGEPATLYYYTYPDDGHCAMILMRPDDGDEQKLATELCRRLDAILVDGAAGGQ